MSLPPHGARLEEGKLRQLAGEGMAIRNTMASRGDKIRRCDSVQVNVQVYFGRGMTMPRLFFFYVYF